MAQWDNYSNKAAPADSDTMMIKDNAATGKPNKRVLFSGLWDWIVSKLANAVISSLTTNPKTVTGGMNALQTAVNTLDSNLNSIAGYKSTGSFNDLKKSGLYMVNGLTDGPNVSGVSTWAVQVLSSGVVGTDGATVKQVAYVESGDKIYTRQLIAGTWSGWIAQPTRDEVNALNNKQVSYTLNDSSTTFNIPNGYRGLIIVSDSSTDRDGMWFLHGTGAGGIGTKEVVSSSIITFATATHKLIVNVSSGTPLIVFLTFSATAPTKAS